MTKEMPELGRFAEPSLYILVSLSEGPKHGYAIMADVERITGARSARGRSRGAGRLEAAWPHRATRPGRAAAAVPDHRPGCHDAARPARADAGHRPGRARTSGGSRHMTPRAAAVRQHGQRP